MCAHSERRHTPFADQSGNYNRKKIYDNILDGVVAFPVEINPYLSDGFVDLVLGLLDVDPDERIGRQGWTDIKEHAWFAGFDWTGLANRCLRAPISPDVPPANPTKYFDDFDSQPHPEFTGDDSWCKDI